MAEQKKIDVVIPAYKPGEKFQKLIKMLQKQTYPIHEILIMNTEESIFSGGLRCGASECASGASDPGGVRPRRNQR